MGIVLKGVDCDQFYISLTTWQFLSELNASLLKITPDKAGKYSLDIFKGVVHIYNKLIKLALVVQGNILVFSLLTRGTNSKCLCTSSGWS